MLSLTNLILSSRFTKIILKVLQRGLLQATLTHLGYLEPIHLALFLLENVLLSKSGM